MSSIFTPDDIDLYYDRPDWFAEDFLEFTPDDWQREAMIQVAASPRFSVRSGQGVGKTGVEAQLVLWYLCTRPTPKVICTAPTERQLYDVLWAEVAKWLSSSKIKDYLKWTKTKVYMIGEAERWWATTRTASKPENMQGFHEDYMLFIIDEASGVEDKILEAILGTLTGYENKIAMFGNPTKTSGIFYDSHNRDRDQWSNMKVSSRNSERTSKDNIAMLEKKYGKDSDVVRVRVDGEFPKGESDSLIPLEIVEMASKTKVNVRDCYKLYVGVDVARFGSDKTTIYFNIGKKKFFEPKIYSRRDTMETVGNIVLEIENFKKEYPSINEVFISIDTDGLGAGVYDRLVEVNNDRLLNYNIYAIHNNAKPNDDKYYNKISELYGVAKELFENNMSLYLRGEEPILEVPYDDELIKELSTRKYGVHSNGKIKLQSKDEYKKVLGHSPDKGDGFIYSLNDVETEHLYLGGTAW